MGTIRYVRAGVAALAIAGLGGCAAHMAAMSPAWSNAPQDMRAMCEMHNQMMAGKSEAERRAIVDEHMKQMSPQMRQHMQQMQASCR